VRTHTRRSRVARLWAALAALVVVPATLAVSTSSAGAAGSNTLTVKAGEYTYVLKGSPKAGWTQITFDNAGVETHMMAMFKLKKGTTNAQLKTAVLANDDSAFNKIADTSKGDPTVTGSPNLLSAGKSTTTYTQLPAGTYGIACFIPAASDGKPHAAHGMYKVFTVSGKSNAKPPTDGVTEVTVSDAGISAPSGGVPAHGWVKVTNNSSAGRDVALGAYTSDAATFEQANDYYNTFFNSGKPPEGDPPAALEGGVSNLAASGGSGYFELDLSKGRYVFVSSKSNENDATPLHLDFTVS
jgi:uncharacterized cupredoxin-like copper-binding protein